MRRSKQLLIICNADIILLHEIVSTGEALLASLPERERLPTDAMFKAADEVLPKYGFTPEDIPHISSLLFRIGGQRGPESLLDKFRAILRDMGIELVFSDDSLASMESADPPSLDVSDQDEAVHTPRAPLAQLDDLLSEHSPSLATQKEAVKSPSPMPYAPLRRRNSDSVAMSLVTPVKASYSGPDKPTPWLERAHSSAELAPPGSQKKEVRFSDVIDTQSISQITLEHDPSSVSTIENIPFRSKEANGSAHPRPETQPGEYARPTTRAENRPPPDFSDFGQQIQGLQSQLTGHSNGDVLAEEEFSSISMDLVGLTGNEPAEDPSLPRYPTQHEERSDAQDRESTETTDEHHDLRHDEYSTQLPYRNVEDEEAMDKPQIAFLASREQMFKMSSFNHWNSVSRYSRAYDIRAEAHAEQWDAWETIGEALEVWIESALTMHVDENDGLQAYQEHLQQNASIERSKEPANLSENMDLPLAPALSEGNVHPRVKQSIERSRSSIGPGLRTERQGRQTSQSVERILVEDPSHRPLYRNDSHGVQSEQLHSFGQDWDHGFVPQSVDDESDYGAEEEPEEQEAERFEAVFRSQYQIAAAAWDYFLVSKAFTHWANRADEEVQRTQVARRHILRRKCFNAWLSEGEKDETEAESKAVWFSQLVVMKQWRDIAAVVGDKSRRMRHVAVRREKNSLVEDTLTKWHHASKMQLAEAIDSRRLQTACLQHWAGEDQWLASAHEEAEGIYRGTMVGRYMRYWIAEARIQERAEQGAGPVITRRDEFLRSGLALAWRHEAEEAKAREKVAIIQELSSLANHWVYETRLIAWQEEQDADLLDSATYHWYCEWRLILCQRVLEQQEKARFLEKWADAARTSSARSYHLRHLARDVRYHDSITGFFNSSLDALEQLEMQAYHARGMIVQRAIPRVVRKWTMQLSHHHQMERWSELECFFTVGETMLPHWQVIRKQEWKKRMHRLYRDFKYRVNRDLVRHCLDGWRQGTADSITKGWEADDMRIEDDNALVIVVAEEWRSKTEFATFSREVSEDADKEVHLILWHSLLEAQEESRLDAVEYNFAQMASTYWDEWTLTSVAMRGKEHAVQEFMVHNTRRDVRHCFVLWASQTSAFGNRVPEMMDFRATRRSSRWTTPVPPRTRNMVDYTPFRTPARPNFRLSSTTPIYRPPSELTFDEGDEDELED